MSDKPQVALPESTATIAQASITTATPSSIHDETKKRLELYSNLFGQAMNNSRCAKTGLQFASSLHYSLHTFLHLCDKNWVLAIVDIAEIDKFDKKYGQLAKQKILQIATVIRKFCENDSRKLKAFKYNDDGDLFALLMYCYPKLDKCEKYILKLINKIEQQTNESVCVGIAKMNEWETFEEWKHRAMKNLENVKNTATETMVKESKTSNSFFFSDIGVDYVNPKLGARTSQDEKKQQEEQQRGPVAKLGTQQDFDRKMQEIANNEDYDWIVALMTIDDFDSFVFSCDNNQEMIKNEIKKMKEEIYRLFDIYQSFYGNDLDTQEEKYFGYNLSNRNTNGKFGLILYDSEDRNKCYVPAHEMLETIKEEISMKCLFTVSIGASRLIEDDLGFSDDWYERARKNLEKTKTNEICFGGKVGDVEMESKLAEIQFLNVCDDLIQAESIKMLDKYGFAAAVDVTKVTLIANDGNLVNEKSINIKVDFDPTETMALNFTSNITYKQILLEVTQFIHENNNDGNGRYLEYPKFYLNSNKPKCKNAKQCQQCCGKKTNKNMTFSVCATKRRQMGQQLFAESQERECVTKSLSTTWKQLFLPDYMLIQESKEYQLNPNWFVNVYSFLQWQKEVITAWLDKSVHSNLFSPNLFQLKDINQGTDEEKIAEYVAAPPDGINNNSSTNEVEKSIFLHKFDLLTSLHSYLEQLIEYLVLYYTCFDGELWIAVFYPCIEAAIGTYHCKMLFAKSHRLTSEVSSICGDLLTFNGKLHDLMKNELKLQNADRCLQEMKAVSIFKQILYNVYDEETLEQAGNGSNPFDLAHQIYIKLQATVNNIKSQLKIQELKGTKVHESGKKHRKRKNDRKDDWVADTPVMNPLKVQAPSFIRLFVIRRVIERYLANSNSKGNIQQMTNIFRDNATPNSKCPVVEIVTRLITDGIKIYMNKWYNENDQLHTIEMIFNQIILKKFAKEYDESVTYNGKHSLVFNSSDLMCYIFQYLTYSTRWHGDLFWCSLICTHWLYHIWNINSVYFVNLTKLIKATSKYTKNDENNILRMWQRIVNARSIYLRGTITLLHPVNATNHNDNVDVMSKISMLGNVRKLEASLDTKSHSISILKILMQRCEKRIENCKIQMLSKQENKLSPLNLKNAQSITIRDLYFYRIWSYKCKQLVLTLNNMSQQWLKFVVQHCDCSNVNTLKLFLVRTDDTEIDKMILTRFVSKLVGLQHLKLVFQSKFDHNVLLVWKLLTPTIEKRNGTVEMILDDNGKLAHDESQLLQNTIKQNRLKINKCNKICRIGLLTGQTIDDWMISEIMETTEYGNIYQATRIRDTNVSKAAATFIQTFVHVKRNYTMIRNEINALYKSNHKNIIRLLSYNLKVKKVIKTQMVDRTMLVFENTQNGNLYNYLKYNGNFDLTICKPIFDQIVDGLDYLHNTLNIAHRDLNPKNLLLDDTFNIKIANFGCCKIIDTQNIEAEITDISKRLHSTQCGSIGYIPPEMFYRRNSENNIIITKHKVKEQLSCDIFSLGIILWKMIVGINSKPFEDFEPGVPVFSVQNYPIYRLIEEKKYDLWWKQFVNDMPYYSDNDLKQLFTQMFDPSPKTRITVSGIKNNKWHKKNDVKNIKHKDDYFMTQMKRMAVHKTIAMHVVKKNKQQFK